MQADVGMFAAGLASAGLLFVGAGTVARRRAVSLVRSVMAEEFRGVRRQVAAEMEKTEHRIASRMDVQEKQLGTSLGQRLGRLNERLVEINTATASLQSLQRQVADLDKVLAGPRTRGIFGEVQLQRLVSDVLPPSSFTMQAPLRKGKVRVDCLIRVGDDEIPVDSKFPLDAYRDLAAAGTSGYVVSARRPGEPLQVKDSRQAQVAEARERLSKHMREHVKTIADKYIVPGETVDFALCFLPSEAVFAEIVEKHDDVLTLAHTSRVFIVSPMTFHATLTCFRSAIKDARIREKTSAVFKELEMLKVDLERLKKRSELVERDYSRSQENMRLMKISADKVYNRGSKICDQDAFLMNEQHIPAAISPTTDAAAAPPIKPPEQKRESSTTAPGAVASAM